MNVDWHEREIYMWARHGVSAAEADEAVSDELAIWFDPDPRSRSGEGIRVIGFCLSRAQVLTVILVRKEAPHEFWGVNGWQANGRDLRTYREMAP